MIDISSSGFNSAFPFSAAVTQEKNNNEGKFFSVFKRYLSRAGFTMVEIIAVLALISVIAAVSAPSMIGFVRHGKQVNRMNIARTIYLGTQNQLTKSRIEKSLKSGLARPYYTNATGEIADEPVAASLGDNQVALSLTENGGSFSDDADNAPFVHYISKPKGYVPAGMEPELDDFYNLLNSVILDKAILDDAILIEYNIRTGVVLSVFYGDMLADGEEFDYLPIDNTDRNNVTGGRGMNSGYQFAAAREQGFYGVESTGTLPPDIMPEIIDIYDGADRPLNDGYGNSLENVLYAEFLLPVQYDEFDIPTVSLHNLELINAGGGSIGELPSFRDVNLNGLSLSGFTTSAPPVGMPFVYLADDSVVIEDYNIRIGEYNKYIWIIDYVGGDLLNGMPLSIGERYLNSSGGRLVITPQNVRARLTNLDGGETVTSLTSANTHFRGILSDGSYEIKSARHLNNIRYTASSDLTSYRQTSDINMQMAGNEISNFAPIADFRGNYTGRQISNLAINTEAATSPLTDVGLFADTSGIIRGVSLVDAEIKATYGGFAGAIAGRMTGGKISESYVYGDISASGGTSVSVGGLVGSISSTGILEKSFNAGFFDTHEDSGVIGEAPTAEGTGSVTGSRGNIGGLVGVNSGKITNCFNNARVNVLNAKVSGEPDWLSSEPVSTPLAAPAFLGGIAGSNSGTIDNTYATNHVGSNESGSVSGGIAGNNGGTIAANSSFYISNGCTDEGAIPKEELRSKLAGPLSSFTAGNEPVVGDNSYENYPYPTLKNNNPFSDGLNWGWEDILGVSLGSVQLVYYELYNDNTWGFSQNSHESKLKPLVSEGSPKLVVNDGYAVEFSYFVDGYKMIIGEDSYRITVTRAGSAVNWNLENNEGADITPQWLAPREFSTDDGDIMYRLYIPNYISEPLYNSGTQTAFALYLGADTEPDADPESVTEPLREVTFTPPFAPAANGVIRSPRHIDNIDLEPDGSYTQRLNVDFALYCKELTAGYTGDTNERLTSAKLANAAVTGTFVGSYNGSGRLISNLAISTSSDNAGLFAVNEGTIKKVTLLNPNIIGGSNVGAVAGTNEGEISFCSVQQTAAGPSAVATGAGPVGGVVGLNEGTLEDVAVVSVSSSPAVRRTGTSGGMGGIVGENADDCTVDRIMYLAVAPRTGTGAATVLFPFEGSGTIGDNKFYLAGRKAIRPFQTTLDANTSYNNLSSPPDGGYASIAITKQDFTDWEKWYMDGCSNAEIIDRDNTVYPYPYPDGTVKPPVREWPIADDMDAILERAEGIVYFERYKDGTNENVYGIFTRAASTDDPRGYKEIDHLRDDLPILESGYAVWGGGANWDSTRGAWTSQNNGKNWKNYKSFKLRDKTFTMPGLNQEFSVLSYKDFLLQLDIDNPIEPIVIWVNSDNGAVNDASPVAKPLGLAYINPYFAKEVYPSGFDSNPWRVTSTQMYPKEHFIRTPWQMQNISRVTGAVVSKDHTFTQEFDLSFATAANAESNNGYTPTVAASTANIVTGAFDGTYEGNAKRINNLTINNKSNEKGLFREIAANGTVKNLTMYACKLQDGTSGASGSIASNGGFAFRNNGLLSDIAFVSADASAPVTSGGNCGGIVYENEGTIERALYIAQSPASKSPISHTGNGTVDAYYLSGSTTTVTNIDTPFNNFDAAMGVRMTTQELNALELNTPESDYLWNKNVATTSNTMMASQYPYPFMGEAPPSPWPVATSPALRLAYYEKYGEDAVGFYTNEALNTLDNESDITEAGYCAIVPRAGGYSIKQTSTGMNTHILSSEFQNSDGTTTHYVILPQSIIMGSNMAVEIYVNDNQVVDVNSRFINTLFAKAVFAGNEQTGFAIRTSQQMRNISRLTSAPNRTGGLTFIQERDLDFGNLALTDSVVTGDFMGIYDGGGKAITTLSISSSAAGANIGLFSQNSGIIRKLTLDFGESARIRGLSNVGGIAGANNTIGVVEDISVISTASQPPVAGATAGGVSGRNSGEIARVLYLALAPSSADVIFPISGTTGGTVSFAYYLSGNISANNPGGILTVGDYNTAESIYGNGEPKTTAEMHALSFANWQLTPGISDEDAMTASEYPYQYIGSVSEKWPVASNSAYVAYYETYEDGAYGYHLGIGSSLPSLDNNKVIKETGYCVIIPEGLRGDSVLINGVATDVGEVEGRNFAKIQFASTDAGLTGINVDGKNTGSYINTLFAKGVYQTVATSSYYVRTPVQMQNISGVNTEDKTFAQDRDIDFRDIDLNSDGAVIAGEFKGTFNGNGMMITGVSISCGYVDNDNQGLEYVGLFSKNSGIIENVKMKGYSDNPITITGRKNVGGIVGHNMEKGEIKACVVEGTEYTDGEGVKTYKGVHIEATDINAGGIAGVNDGIVEGCTVKNTMQTIKGADFVGGITGINGAKGIITEAAVENVKLEAVGANVGKIAGKDESGKLGEAISMLYETEAALPEGASDSPAEPEGKAAELIAAGLIPVLALGIRRKR